MVASWVVVLAAASYLLGLFALAFWGDRSGRHLLRGRLCGAVHALALGVYCTSWAFFGSVGLAARSGLDFLAVSLGPMLTFGLFWPFVARVVRLAKAQNITSVADFVAARYGKSERVAALVCVVALAASVPYIALQLRAVSASLQVLLRAAPGAEADAASEGWSALLALGLAGFAVIFGARRAYATEHQDGLMLAVALESVVKLLAFLGVGAFVLLGIGSRLPDPSAVGEAARALVGRTSDLRYVLALTAITGLTALLLPRQFHVMVVESRSEADARRAAWAFPLYLLAFTLPVLPLAAASLAAAGGADLDHGLAAIALPLRAEAGWVTLLAFLGGFSAAAAMIIVESVAVGVMTSNHLIMPLVLRRYASSAGAVPPDLGGLLLWARRAIIAGVILLAWLYGRAADEADLVAIGLLSLAAVAQVAPAFFGGLLWEGGTARGAAAGLVTGLLVWAYTLLLPSLVGDEGTGLVAAGPWGIAALKPTALLGLDLPELTNGAVWSLGLNLAAYIGVSLWRRPTGTERLQAEAFTRGGEASSPGRLARPVRTRVAVGELETMVARYVGRERARSAFAAFWRDRGGAPPEQAAAGGELLRFAEHLLASVLGAASSRLALELLPDRGSVGRADALSVLDDAARVGRSRSLLQHALNHAGQGITVYDRELHLLAWNRAFVELNELPADLVRVGVRFDDIVRFNLRRGFYGPGQPDHLVEERLRSFVEEEAPHRLRLVPAGRVLEIRTNRLPEGGWVTTYTDITERVAAEELRERQNELLEARVRERTEALTRLNRELAQAKAEAEEANRSKTRFLAAAGHDILQPLNAARLYAAALVERDRERGEARLAENVDASLDAVEEILAALLDISRLDAGALKPHWSAFALGDLLDQIRREFEPVAGGKGLELTVLPSAALVRSDRRMLRRLVQNLVSNAIKYTASGQVLVGVRRRGVRVRLEVWDTGRGIPASQHRLVFQEFRRLAGGAEAEQGLGLGLSIVERIARVLDHPVTLVSEPGRGSVFRVDLPRAEAQAGGDTDRAPASAPRAAPFGRLSILAIDNEPAILDGMRILLERWGCAVRLAASAEEAERLAASCPPDGVIADYHLDRGSGLDTIARLRRARGPDLPALLLTADRSPALRAEAEKAGVPILTKPVKPAALRALLAGWQAARGGGQSGGSR